MRIPFCAHSYKDNANERKNNKLACIFHSECRLSSISVKDNANERKLRKRVSENLFSHTTSAQKVRANKE